MKTIQITIGLLVLIAISSFATDPIPVREGAPKIHSNGSELNPLAFNITPTNETDSLFKALVVPGTGITVTKVTFTGASTAAGLYYEGPFNMGDGIILATGDVTNALPPNTSVNISTDFGLAGCDYCDVIIPSYVSYDAAILEIVFDVSDSCKSISFEFVFGSEEYPEYVGSLFNDVFGAYLNDVQVSFDNASNPITINGPFFSGGAVQIPPVNGMEYDGSTAKLKTIATVVSGSTGNTLVLVVCDAGDHVLDSGVLLRALKGDADSIVVTSYPPEFILPSGLNCGDTLHVNVNDSVTFTIEAADFGPDNDLVTLSVGALPPGALMNPTLPQTGNPVISTFSWVPAVGQTGSYPINFHIEDSISGLSDNCSFILLVENSVAGDTTPPVCELIYEGCLALGTGTDVGDSITGIFGVQLEQGSVNLILEIDTNFISGDTVVYYTVSLINPTVPGSGVITVTDNVGLSCQSVIEIDCDLSPREPSLAVVPNECPTVIDAKPFYNIITDEPYAVLQPKRFVFGEVIVCAIYGTPDFDVTNIDIETLTLNTMLIIANRIGDVGTASIEGAELCDCNTFGPDGIPDLVFEIMKPGMILAPDSVEYGDVLEMKAEFQLFDGTSMTLSDCVTLGPEDGFDLSPVDTRLTLAQNFPNPFNPTTNISFRLSNASDVQLEVFNLLGQKVTTVYEGRLVAGVHSFTWDGSTVASGVYLYKLTTGGFIQTKKMILMK